jgi:hypothetical protein
MVSLLSLRATPPSLRQLERGQLSSHGIAVLIRLRRAP